jgi:hypothetical protein
LDEAEQKSQIAGRIVRLSVRPISGDSALRYRGGL